MVHKFKKLCTQQVPYTTKSVDKKFPVPSSTMFNTKEITMPKIEEDNYVDRQRIFPCMSFHTLRLFSSLWRFTLLIGSNLRSSFQILSSFAARYFHRLSDDRPGRHPKSLAYQKQKFRLCLHSCEHLSWSMRFSTLGVG